MKNIGRTQTGGYIVEMSDVEYSQLSMLFFAVEGKPPADLYIRNSEYVFRTGFDFTKTFEVMRAFYEAHFRLTELQGLINEIRESLNNV